MTVPTKMGDLSSTIGNNSPAGTDTIGTSLDDYIRAAYGIMKQGSSRGSDIASVTTITIPDAGSYFVVTGTTTITGINDSWTGRMVVLKFSGALQLTNSSGLILPGGANITTVAGDVGIFVNESTGVWRCAAWTSGSFAALTTDDVDNTPVNGATTDPVSSNWAFDHAADTAAHGITDTADLTYNSDTDISGNGWVDNNVSNNLSTKVPTEAAVKTYIDASNGFGAALLHVKDQKVSGTNGGSSSIGSNTRVLNTIVTNEISGASLASNQITLPAGTYYLEAYATAYAVDRHQLRVYDTTGIAFITDVDGTTELAVNSSNGYGKSNCAGRFTLSVQSVLELRHMIEKAQASNGLGVAAGTALTVDHETYSDVRIWKIA